MALLGCLGAALEDNLMAYRYHYHQSGVITPWFFSTAWVPVGQPLFSKKLQTLVWPAGPLLVMACLN